MAAAPMTQETTAAGPAATTAFWAPYSQPEPMMEPTDAHMSPISPTSRRRPPPGRSVTFGIWSTFTIF